MNAPEVNGAGGTTRARLEARVEELRREASTGEQRLHELAVEQARVRDTVLRLEGAILALTELLDPGAAAAGAAPAGGDPAGAAAPRHDPAPAAQPAA